MARGQHEEPLAPAWEVDVEDIDPPGSAAKTADGVGRLDGLDGLRAPSAAGGRGVRSTQAPSPGQQGAPRRSRVRWSSDETIDLTTQPIGDGSGPHRARDASRHWLHGSRSVPQRRGRRSPGLALAAGVVLAAVLAAWGLGRHHQAADALQLARDPVTGLEVGRASLTFDAARLDHDDQGRLLTRMRVPVTNASQVQVQLSIVGVWMPHAVSSTASAVQWVPAASRQALVVPLAVDCSALSAPPIDGEGRSPWLRIQVSSEQAGAAPVEIRQDLLVGQSWSSLGEQLAYACGPLARPARGTPAVAVASPALLAAPSLTPRELDVAPGVSR